MAKVYKITSRGSTWEQVANNASEVKAAVAAKFGMQKVPKGTVITKIGLSKDKPVKAGKVKVIDPAPAPAPVKSEPAKTLEKGTVIKGPGGKTYTVGQRGRIPPWVAEKMGKVAAPVKGAVPVAAVSGAMDRDHGRVSTEPKSGVQVNSWFVAAKPVTLTNVTYALDVGGKITYGYVGDEAEIEFPKGTKYGIILDHSKLPDRKD
jgi:hypothetical protein